MIKETFRSLTFNPFRHIAEKYKDKYKGNISFYLGDLEYIDK